MAVDEQSSQDSTLIDDDLVAALGFEPVTTIDVPTESQSSTDDDVLDEADVRVDDADTDDSSNGELNGFSIGEVDASGDAFVEDSADVIDDRGSFFDLDSSNNSADDDDSADDSETLDDLAEAEVADVIEVEEDSSSDAEDDSVEALVDELVVDEALEEQDTDDLEIVDELPEAEALSLDEASLDDDEMSLDEVSLDVSLDDLTVDDVLESDLDSVPSIADLDIDTDATAPVSMIDLDIPDTDLDLDLDLDLDTDAALDVEDVIDLEVVDLSDAPLADDLAMQGFVDDEVHELADADSVFADSTPVLDPPIFDDVVGHPATETVDHVGSGLLDLETADETVGTAAVATAATATATKGRRRLRARKSRRVIRHIDPWSVLTFSVLFHMVVFAALLLSSVLVWNAAIASGMVENVESFIQELGDYETFEINADVMFRAAIVIAGMLTLASSVLVVLLTVVFNLISDLVGGIRVTVIEEETVRVPIDKKRSKARNE